MTGKMLIGLVGVAVIAAGAAYFVARPGAGGMGEAPATGGMFLSTLGERVNDVAEIRVKHANKPANEFTLKRDEKGGWTIPERGGYPAKFEKVKDVIVGLSQLQTSEELTSKPENYARLGVQDPATYVEAKEGEAASGNVPTSIVLRDGKGAEVASVIVGGSKWGQPPGTYVRRPGEARAWLCSGRVDVPNQVSGWVESEFLRLGGGRVKSARLTHKDSPEILVVKNAPADTAWAVQNVPEGKKLRGPNIGDQIALAASSIALDDVAPVESIDFDGAKGGKPGSTFEFRTFDGLVLSGAVAEKDGVMWLRANAAVDESAKAPEGAEGMKSLEDVKKEAEDLNGRLGKFAFALPQWKRATFQTQLSTFFEDTPPTAPATLQDPNVKSLQVGPGAAPAGPAPATPVAPAPLPPPAGEPKN